MSSQIYRTSLCTFGLWAEDRLLVTVSFRKFEKICCWKTFFAGM